MRPLYPDPTRKTRKDSIGGPVPLKSIMEMYNDGGLNQLALNDREKEMAILEIQRIKDLAELKLKKESQERSKKRQKEITNMDKTIKDLYEAEVKRGMDEYDANKPKSKTLLEPGSYTFHVGDGGSSKSGTVSGITRSFDGDDGYPTRILFNSSTIYQAHGGGGGGMDNYDNPANGGLCGGGGGGGGVLTNAGYQIIKGTTYTVTVGNGTTTGNIHTGGNLAIGNISPSNSASSYLVISPLLYFISLALLHTSALLLYLFDISLSFIATGCR